MNPGHSLKYFYYSFFYKYKLNKFRTVLFNVGRLETLFRNTIHFQWLYYIIQKYIYKHETIILYSVSIFYIYSVVILSIMIMSYQNSISNGIRALQWNLSETGRKSLISLFCNKLFYFYGLRSRVVHRLSKLKSTT